MRNFILALAISIAIHFLLLYNFKDIKKPIYQPVSQKATSLKYTHIQLASIKKVVKKTEIVKEITKPVMKKEKIYKKVLKKNIKIDKLIKSVFTKKIKLKPKIKKPIVYKKVIKAKKKKINIIKEQKEIQQLDRLTQSYIKLYGKRYFNLSQDVKKYLKENLREILQITEEYLRYPRIAIKMKQSGTSILEFTLKPNGDITNLKIIRSSQHNILDKNSIKTIKMAYKDYPLVTEDTLIRIYVQYLR